MHGIEQAWKNVWHNLTTKWEQHLQIRYSRMAEKYLKKKHLNSVLNVILYLLIVLTETGQRYVPSNHQDRMEIEP
jgi:hypothetical protein